MKTIILSAKEKTFFAFLLSIFSFILFLPGTNYAQAYIKQSRYLGGNGNEYIAGGTKIVNGEKYIVGSSNALAGTNTYPVTMGGANPGRADIIVTKLNSNGTIAWSRFIGSSKFDYAKNFIVVNNYIYIVGYTDGVDFPTTDGSSFLGTDNVTDNGFLVKINATTGALEFSSLLGRGYCMDVQYYNGSIFVEGQPVVGSVFQISVTRYDALSNVLIYKRILGGSGYCYTPSPQQSGRSAFKVVNGIIYLAGYTPSADFPVTDGSINPNPGSNAALFVKLDAATGAINFATYFGSTSYYYDFSDIVVDNGNAYLLGDVYHEGAIVTTDGSTFNGDEDFYSTNSFVMKWDSNNKIVFSKLVAFSSSTISRGMQLESGTLYLAGSTSKLTIPGAPAIPDGIDKMFLVKLDAATGSLNSSIYLGSNNAGMLFYDFAVVNGNVYLTGSIYGDNYPVTNGSTRVGSAENVFTKIGSDNSICYSTYFGGINGDFPASIAVVSDSVYITGATQSNDFPVTDNSSYAGSGGRNNITFTQFVFNPAITGITDTTSPSTQSVCKNGIAQTITAPEILLTSANMPKLYRNGVGSYQPAVICRYQWQVSDNPSGPWTNIPGAVKKDYTPQVQLVNQYYRRLAYTSACANDAISTSSVASVLVTADAAPTVNAGGVLNTCSGTPITLGGTPTATPSGSATISTYEWTPVDTYSPGNNVGNPIVTPTVTTIYTVTVTDSKGCKNAAQALVNVYKADAGPDKPTCAGQTVRIGSAPIAGLTGVTYSWTASPADGTMSCSNCAQPDVHPTITTTYTLNVTIPVTGGGTCTTSDQVVVTPVTGPTAGFGGSDITVCNSGSGTLGQASQAGFTYTWAPGLYLSNVNMAQPTFTPGNLSYPNPNPFVYTVTMSKSGCSFTDQVQAYTIGADAGPDKCGPTTIGIPDKTPSINETYSWALVSGDGHIIGASNTPQVSVSATTSGITVYRLTVTYNGVTCTDDVNITNCACIKPDIKVDAPFNCASYDVNGGNVKLTASSSIASTFSWSPAAGLSSSTGATVTLTDNVPRTYTVTATSTIDPTYSCTNTITVNQPGWAKPSFAAQQVTVCPNTAVQIGQATVAGYSYAWAGSGLNNNAISNPTATVNSTTKFPVLVTETTSGCTVTDTAVVNIPGFPGNLAGPDISICGSSIVQLGTEPVPGLTYVWTPAATYNPNSTAANPKVLVTTTTTFHVQATNTASGCIANDDIVVTVNPAAPSFSLTDQTFCPGTPGAVALPAGPSGMSAYNWSPASLVQNPTSNGPTAKTQNPPPSTATTYTLTVTNSSGCKSAASMTLSPSIPNPVAGSSRTVCKSNTVQLGTSPGMAGTYSWSVSPSSGATYTMSSTSISNPVFTPTSAGTFTITVSYTQGGCTTTDKVIITGIDYTIPTMTSPIVCQNSCAQIGISNPDPGAQYSWSPVNGLSNPNISYPTACVGTSSQTYRLTAIGSNGCPATQDVFVGVNPQATPSVSIPPASACYGSGSTTFFPNISPSGTYQYLWSPDDGSLDNIYKKNPVVYITSTGTKKYFLSVTDAGTGCNANAQGLLTSDYCPLPVKLESFTATPHGKNVLLEWKVSAEIDFAYYVVEHSTNAYDFNAIGTKNATNSSVYQLLHSNPAQGVNYYRLKMVDADGKFSYSDVRKVNFNGEGAMPDVKLYPNPADNLIHISLPKEMANKKGSILVIATDGRIVLKKEAGALNVTETIQTQQLAKGKYYIRIATEDNIIVSKPLIILR